MDVLLIGNQQKTVSQHHMTSHGFYSGIILDASRPRNPRSLDADRFLRNEGIQVDS